VPQQTKLLAVLLATGLLAACAGEKKAEPVAQAPAPVVEQAPVETAAVPEEEVFEATPGLSAKERFRKSIRLLETGQSGQAKAELEAYLAEVHNSSLAENLLKQIVTPVDEYFPAESFTVKMKSGESLSTLAKSYLGDALKFYALSKYNKIDNPSQVTVGQEIRIPATEAALAAKEAIAAGPQTPMVAEEAPAAKEMPAEAPAIQPEKAAAAAEMTGWGKVDGLAAAGDYPAAAMALKGMGGISSPEEAQKGAQIYMAAATAMGRSDPKPASDYALRAGKLYLNKLNRPEQAMEALQLSTSLDPSNTEAQEQLSAAEATVADYHYREGLAAYRKQELDKAIASWDRVLEIDPEHANASLYRAQALDLKEKLSKMK